MNSANNEIRGNSGATGDPFAALARLPGVSEAISDARTTVDRLLGQRILHRRGVELSAESIVRGARASAVLEGADVSLEAVKSGESRSAEVLGALRAGAELAYLAPLLRSAPRQTLARLHVLVAVDMVGGDDDLGRPRRDQQVHDPLRLGAPPRVEEVIARLDALTDALVAARRTPALLVAAVVHGELLALRPFGWGNGLIARAAARLALIEWGLDPKALVPLETGHLELADGYRDALRGYQAGTPDGLARWIRHCADALQHGVRESLSVCEALRRG